MARKEAGQAYLQEILAKIPDETRRKAIETEIAKNEELIEALGDGVLRQSDYSKKQDELRKAEEELKTYKGQLETWHETQKGYLEEYKALKEKGAAPPPPTPPPTPAPPAQDERLTKALAELEDAKKNLGRIEVEGVAYMNTLTKLANAHRREFNEDLDPDALVDYANKHKVNLVEAHNQMFKEQRETAAKAKREEEIKAAEQRGRDAVMREVRSQLPHVVNTTEPSTLDGLKPKDGEVGGRRAAVAAATEDFYQNAGKRAGAEA